MKAFVLAVGLLFCGGGLCAQKAPAVGIESAAPFKGGDVIVITTPDSATTAYTKLGRLLLTSGYALDKSDKELGFISTVARPVANGRSEIVLRFTVVPPC